MHTARWRLRPLRISLSKRLHLFTEIQQNGVSVQPEGGRSERIIILLPWVMDSKQNKAARQLVVRWLWKQDCNVGMREGPAGQEEGQPRCCRLEKCASFKIWLM